MIHKIFTLLFLCCLGCFKMQGQQDFCKNTDSLGARTYFIKATQASQKGKYKEAIAFFQKSGKLYEQVGCQGKAFLMNRNILRTYIRVRDYLGFNAFFYKTIKTVEFPATKEEFVYKGRLYLLKSEMCVVSNDIDSAAFFAQKAKQVHEQKGAWKYYIRDNTQLAKIAFRQQDYESMERFLDNSFSAYKTYIKVENRLLQEIMGLYGALYYKTGDYEEALDKTMNAVEVVQKDMKTQDDTLFLARFYNNIGLFYIELGDIYKAEDYCNNSLYLFKKLGNYFDAATTNLNLGEFFARQGKLEEALSLYNSGIQSLAKSKGVPPYQLDQSYINMYNGIAYAATELGSYKEAYEAIQKNLDIHKRQADKKDETFSVCGLYYRAIGNYNTSLEYYQKALKIRHETYGTEHPLIAKVYFNLGQTEQKKNHSAQAQMYYNLAKQAIKVPAKQELISFLMNKDSADAIPDKAVLLKILDAEARLLQEKDALELANNKTEAAVLLLEKMRNNFKEEGSKLFMVQTMIPTYELSIGVSLDLYQRTQDRRYLEEAFQLVEKSKAMLLLDALKAEEARNFGNVPKKLLNEERRLARERVRYEKLLFEAKSARDESMISWHQKELLKLKRASEKLQDTLENNYPKYHELKYNTQIANLEQVQKDLDSQTALIEFFVGANHIYIFSVYSDTVWVTKVPMDNQFMSAIRGLRTALTDVKMLTKDIESSYLLLTKNGRLIYQKFLEPALKKEGIERLVIIPDGMLNYVPFDVLLTEKPDYQTVNFKTLPYLIKKQTINYHYSSTLKLFSRAPVKTNGKMLAMASSYDKDKFINAKGFSARDYRIRTSVEDLPGAKREVEYLSKTFAGKFLYGTNSNEAMFKEYSKKAPYSVIHLAMHGIVDSKQPEYSSLVFTHSGNKKEDDLLHAYELNLLEINTDLVVLSACETGFGKYERGEGVVSLGRGFMYSGVPSLVMTLWPINDKATSILVSAFYNELAMGYGKDEAMQNAKITYLNKAKNLTAHPFFWASFIQLGDYNPIELKKHWAWWQIILMILPVVLVIFLLITYRKR
ncbi:CHAT domain-containing tetratricopeptide repeat protein [Aureispira sp. CCB-E]|uniref:CHAT domain-containing protein n=1 Tax=Aureispira sp. CCB-E TaxID=3051121 RepID=UPI0028695240|nr:CHAT domain-containing tetratricopeptide repeat protein [Aureispira sp. CCB-E]WMX17297.1 CHAT domain-containing tetratricopeptide repeat protein [Aureispira sp. CCB-E]